MPKKIKSPGIAQPDKKKPSTTTTTIRKFRKTANQGSAWRGKKPWGR